MVIAVMLSGCGSDKGSMVESNNDDELVVAEEVANTESTETGETTPENTDKKVVKLTKISDYSCGVCRQANKTIEKIAAELGDQMELELINFNIFAQSKNVALASECAKEQGEDKMIAFHNTYFDAHFGETSVKDVRKVVEKVGADMTKMDECLDSGRPQLALDNSAEYSRSKGITGTPYFLINDTDAIPGFPRSEIQFRAKIMEYL